MSRPSCTSEFELRRLADLGLYQREIAAALGMTQGYINQVLKRFGIRTHGRPGIKRADAPPRPGNLPELRQRVKSEFPRRADAGSAANPFGLGIR